MKTNTVIDYLDNISEQMPDKMAYEDIDLCLTFSSLREKSRILGSFIAKRQHARKPVMVIMEKGASNLIAFMAAVFAGCFYTPIDNKMPKDRIKLIVDCLKPEVVIYDNKSREVVDQLGLMNISYEIDETLSGNCDEELLESRRKDLKSTDLLYVLFTSGSTGVPKGVSISHRAVIDFTEWVCDTYNLDSEVSLCNQAPFYFDASVPDLFIPLKTGASCYIPPKSYYTFPKKILQYIIQNDINTLIWVPSALCNVVNARAFNVCVPVSVRLVIFCGEVMPCKHLNVWRKYIPRAKYVNMYGPTEATYACTFYNVDRDYLDEEVLPLGRACENSSILILKEDGKEAFPEEIGEICISGECLSSGYYNSVEKTEEAFVQNPLNNNWNEKIYKTGDLAYKDNNGILYFAGRKDYQIKRLGHRIELGEIENIIVSMEEVDNCCCLFNNEKEEIIAVVSGKIDDKELDEYLRSKLPSYMIPSRYYLIDIMPMNINGKIDRARLKELYGKG